MFLVVLSCCCSFSLTSPSCCCVCGYARCSGGEAAEVHAELVRVGMACGQIQAAGVGGSGCKAWGGGACGCGGCPTQEYGGSHRCQLSGRQGYWQHSLGAPTVHAATEGHSHAHVGGQCSVSYGHAWRWEDGAQRTLRDHPPASRV